VVVRRREEEKKSVVMADRVVCRAKLIVIPVDGSHLT
jgi:hypothetical protein